jgi:hypothetical protein
VIPDWRTSDSGASPLPLRCREQLNSYNVTGLESGYFGNQIHRHNHQQVDGGLLKRNVTNISPWVGYQQLYFWGSPRARVM